MAETTARPVEVHAAYLAARGRAMSASTRRLRWRLGRLPRHTSNPLTLATVKAISEELALRGEAVAW